MRGGLQGWLRLWLVVTVGLVGWYGWAAARDFNVQMETGSGWYCVPGSYESHVEAEPDGQTLPSDTEVAREKARLKAQGQPGDDFSLDLEARGNLTRDKTKDVSLFQCVSYGHFISGVVRGLLFSLFAGALFVTISWVIRGFKRRV